ncbi:hypothetical protein GE09DRAFT_1078943 [Coniochaeta sp. 2T2.1]|nr:hypothetical protein GE09DRAFT_1078943 [Coniochaeta sp. 2T2.1]
MTTPVSISKPRSGACSTVRLAMERLLAVTTWAGHRDSPDSASPEASSSSWTTYLESSIPRYHNQLLPLLRSLGFGSPLGEKMEVVDVVEVLISTASFLRDMASSHGETKSGATLTNLLIRLKDEYGIKEDTNSQDFACYQALFILCGLLSMLYEPSTEGQARINAPDWPVSQQLIQPEVPLKNIRDKPLGFFLRFYGQLLPEPRHQAYGIRTQFSKTVGTVEQVYASSLSAYSLRNIGKISFEWTDTLSNHLTFLPLSRTLLLFRYPSFCTMSLWPEGHSIFDIILQEYYTGPDPNWSRSTSLNQEIMLSYRLLFGQDSRSRPIFKEMKESHGLTDPLLSVLCIKGAGKRIYSLPSYYWPVACRHRMEKEGRLREQSSYSLNTDFPLLADRLEILQTYMNNQKSYRKRDMYRDRRNAGEWLASWPVLILALLAIFLSFLQLVVATLQLGYAISPPKQ